MNKEPRDKLRDDLLTMLYSFHKNKYRTSDNINKRMLFPINKKWEIEIIIEGSEFNIDLQQLNFWFIDSESNSRYYSARYHCYEDTYSIANVIQEKKVWSKLNNILNDDQLAILISEIGIKLI